MDESQNSPKPRKQPKLPKTQDVQELEHQLGLLTEALQRERADATNIRRRAEEERVKMAGFYKANIVRGLLPVVDNIDRALKHLPGQSAEQDKLLDWIDGVKKILNQVEKSLTDLGVEKIKTVGETFDPRLHEAVQMDPGDGTKEIVSEEIQAGYKIGDEIVRHAMVRVKMQ